ncbi:glycerol-3-phosphate dehydrogenase [Sphingoaurantiacus capsulatus]|uniref:Glycerol-3-phosphate dehydrogenase n=1 Tax=Sphingoaurantiacus capsulatus TaxID=1771310 RepID=A0ABV7XBX8_9SPHN
MLDDQRYDILIIGGGVNGTGIARDAAGRGLRVALIEAGDLGSGTSSASTKLVHGGLRYLEFYDFALVAKALAEREVILDAAPHISWPQAFVLPHATGLRPAWMIRAGLFLYDHLAKRRQVPGSSAIDLHRDAAGRTLDRSLTRAFRYWDGWIDDSRLVVLNAVDAAARGALIRTRTRAVAGTRLADDWAVELDSGEKLRANHLINAAGPWAEVVTRDLLGLANPLQLRLVQGAHIVIRRINRSDDAFMLQQPDGRIVFMLPYEQDYSLIGTTDTPVDRPDAPAITAAEEAYLLDAVNRYLAKPIAAADIVHRFAGIRPLVLEEGKDAKETTRDWRLVAHDDATLTVVGGKITTYRKLAEAVLKLVAPKSKPWTRGVPLPGGDVPKRRGQTGQAAFADWLRELVARHPDHDPTLVTRLARIHGRRAETLLSAPLGENFGGLFEAELRVFAEQEWARTGEDVLWRRTKMGLHLDAGDRDRVDAWMSAFTKR